MFDLHDWQAKWEANRHEAEANSLADSGWSGAVAHRCDQRAMALIREIVRHLAKTQTLPADLFDRPELVALQEAARTICPRCKDARSDDPGPGRPDAGPGPLPPASPAGATDPGPGDGPLAGGVE